MRTFCRSEETYKIVCVQKALLDDGPATFLHNCALMSLSKLVTDEEYRFILDKVNRVICQFSSSTDKTGEATVFLSRVEEKCTSKAEFLHLIEQRLQVLTNTDKSQEYIEWFKVRRTSLASFLQGIKDKLRQDANYLSKYSPAFTKGVQCLDRLLKLDVEAIGHNHMVDLSRVRKAVLEMKSEIDAKSKTDSAVPPRAPFDEARLYSLLQDAINIVNALSLQYNEASSSKPKLLGKVVISSIFIALALTKVKCNCHVQMLLRKSKQLQIHLQRSTRLSFIALRCTGLSAPLHYSPTISRNFRIMHQQLNLQ